MLPIKSKKHNSNDVQPGERGDLLVVVFLRGGADGLNLVIPYADEQYYNLRPTLGIPRPNDGRYERIEKTIDLDGFFGFHPTLLPLYPFWEQKQLAIVHACGAPDDSHSHFKAMELIERGVSNDNGPATGWIGRHLASLEKPSKSPMRAIGLGKMSPRSLIGPVPVTALNSIKDYHYTHSETSHRILNTLKGLYSCKNQLSTIGLETFKILDSLQELVPETYQPIGEAVYPENNFGESLKQIAMLVKAQIGLEAAAIDLEGWDTHFAQGSNGGLFANLASNLAEGLAAFYRDLRDFREQLTVVVMSEFGRRANENGSLGTDHGHGGVMLLLGGNVNGGTVYGDWPGLSRTQLSGPGDLSVTTDYRDVLGEICVKRLKNPSLEMIFPDYSVQLRNLVS